MALNKPAGWAYVSATPVAADGNRIVFTGTQIDLALDSHVAAPLFALVKYPPPHTGLNPTLGVNLDRAASIRGRAASALLDQRVQEAQTHAGAKFEVVQPVTTLTLAGHPGARVVLRAPGDVPALLTIVNLVVDDTTFMFASAGAETGADAANVEFEQILQSLVIEGRR